MDFTIFPAASITARVASEINSRALSAWKIVGVIPVYICAYYSAFLFACTICDLECISMKNSYLVPTSVKMAK